MVIILLGINFYSKIIVAVLLGISVVANVVLVLTVIVLAIIYILSLRKYKVAIFGVLIL